MAKEEAAACIIISVILDDDDSKKVRGKTREWIKKRTKKGYFTNIIEELRVEDTNSYKEMMRMSYESFLTILRYIEPYINSN